MKNENIFIKGLKENNLKNIDVSIPKQKLVVFTGVSGSGKSSIVFDTIASESQRQLNESYSAFIRNRLPKYPKPHADRIDNLTASIIVDQSPLGGNARSTVGTISDMYSQLRLIFSRIGTPNIGSSSYFSFNNPLGMCMTCSGMGKVSRINIEKFLDEEKTLNDGAIKLSMYKTTGYFFKLISQSNILDMNKKLKDFSVEEKNILFWGNPQGDEKTNSENSDDTNKFKRKKFEGIVRHMKRLFLNRDTSLLSKASQEHQEKVLIDEPCPDCNGARLNQTARSCKVMGYSITELSNMEFTELKKIIDSIKDQTVETVVSALSATLGRLIDIGLPYLSLDRDSVSLSGGEAQRLKLVRYMGSSLTDLTYIFDEPSTGLHPRDVWRMKKLLASLRDKGNSVLVVEHDRDVIAGADEIIDVGPKAGKHGGEIVFQGSYEKLLEANTLTGQAMKMKFPYKEKVRTPKSWLAIEHATLHNLKDVSVKIPEGVMTVVTGVAGSGKSSLISHVFATKYEDRVIKVDQGAITATNRSMPASYLGFFDEIRKLFSVATGESESLFSFNSEGACPVCHGKGFIETELAFMDPVITPCESCSQTRYNEKALNTKLNGKSIVEVLKMTADEAIDFFKASITSEALKKPVEKICKVLDAMKECGLSYMELGQPLSTLSGGERQRVKLAKHLGKKGNIYILDEPTTGLHISDTEKLLTLFDRIVDKGNTIVIIEHDLDVAKHADWIIDVGPDGGKNGGQIVFEGTPTQMRDTSKTITADWMRQE